MRVVTSATVSDSSPSSAFAAAMSLSSVSKATEKAFKSSHNSWVLSSILRSGVSHLLAGLLGRQGRINTA